MDGARICERNSKYSDVMMSRSRLEKALRMSLINYSVYVLGTLCVLRCLNSRSFRFELAGVCVCVCLHAAPVLKRSDNKSQTISTHIFHSLFSFYVSITFYAVTAAALAFLF